jgi:adenylate cyclase
MALEVERRFLVHASAVPRRLGPGLRIVQGYLSFQPLVRVRLVTRGRSAPRGYLTVKGRGLLVRQEFEYLIPAADARVLLELCGRLVLQKVRYRAGPWELDCYSGKLGGLWLAEVELARPGAPLPRALPRWLGREVTADPRYTNSRLARLKRWPPRWARADAREHARP